MWELLLVNPAYPLDPNFAPKELATLSSGFDLDARIAPTLEQMVAAAKLEGIDLLVVSGYRSYEHQQKLFGQKVAEFRSRGLGEEEAKVRASQWVAIPGTSEHQTGLAVDIMTPSHMKMDESYANTPAAKWLLENAARYGFILRYPKDKTEKTGISFEPWHYRYVGQETAQTIMENDLCLEEYLRV